MDIKHIIDAIERYCDIGKDLMELSDIDFVDRVVDPLMELSKLSFDYEMGASKGVLIFPKEQIVIKIPFGAHAWEEGEYEADCEAYEAEEIEKCPEIEDYLNFFDKAENFFIETEHNWDYCELECGIYEEAVKEGLDPYFAKEWWVADIRGYPIYAQIMVQPFNADQTSHSRSDEEVERIHDSCRRLDVECFNSEWIADFFDLYGEEEFKRLSEFLSKLRIYDLHSGNVGYLGRYPILLDYSNYNE